jgi:4-amino-4-deoxy-L-arabinose transferase-like glycosyltransferase
MALAKGSARGWRETFLIACVFWGTFITLSTECLSLFSLITFPWIFALWVAALTVSIMVFIKTKGTLVLPRISGLSGNDVILLCSVIFIVATVGFVALIAPGSNWDSISYHMPRVMHWIQNRTIAFYPTHILRQLHMNPWSEFVILHLQILNGNDRFANLVQWISWIGSILGTTLIARRLGADRSAQIFSAVIVATLPLAILEGSDTLTDLNCAFWIVCFVYFLQLIEEHASWRDCIITGLSLGLAISTKALAYICAFPFFFYFLFMEIKMRKQRTLRHVAIMAACVIFLNLGHYLRNFDLYGSPLDQARDFENTIVNEIVTLPAFVSNVIRNLSLQMHTPFEDFNHKLERSILVLHHMIGIDVEDPRTTFIINHVQETPELNYWYHFHIPKLEINDSTVPNNLYLMFIAFALMLFVLKRKLSWAKICIPYLMQTLFIFVLFCLVVKWTPFSTRYHLPIFVLLAPVTAIALSSAARKNFAFAAALLLVICSLPFVLIYPYKPILSKGNIFTMTRNELYLRSWERYKFYSDYTHAVRFLSEQKYHSIGLSTSEGGSEYLIWVLLRDYGSPVKRIEHVYVDNISSVKAASFPPFDPDAIVSFPSSDFPDTNLSVLLKNKNYRFLRSFGSICVFVKAMSH